MPKPKNLGPKSIIHESWSRVATVVLLLSLGCTGESTVAVCAPGRRLLGTADTSRFNPGPEPEPGPFYVAKDVRGPLRTGALSVYDGYSWRLAPWVDPPRLPADGSLPGAPAKTRGTLQEARITIVRADGVVLPVPPLARELVTDGLPKVVAGGGWFAAPRVKRGSAAGLEYTVRYGSLPARRELRRAAIPTDRAFLDRWTDMKGAEPPPRVDRILDGSGTAVSPWDALERVRTLLASRVTVSGGVVAVGVPPERVAEMIAGGEATEFELVAALGMLARWLGIPARIGFGYAALQPTESGVFCSDDLAVWVEIHLKDTGWLPLPDTLGETASG